jgi:hypothetical protein
LYHHGVDNAKERLIAREQACAACEGVALEHALAGVLGENLDDASTLPTGSDIPLEVSTALI